MIAARSSGMGVRAWMVWPSMSRVIERYFFRVRTSRFNGIPDTCFRMYPQAIEGYSGVSVEE